MFEGGTAESCVMQGHSTRSPLGIPGAHWTHPELLGLQVLIPPLILVVIHEGAI